MGSGWAWTCTKSSDIDSLLEQGRTAVKKEDRIKIYTDLQKLIMEQAMVVPIRMFTNPMAARAEVKGVRFDPEGFLPDLYEVTVEK